MNRWLWFSICAVLGVLTLGRGLLMPVYLRAVDARVIERAGVDSTGLIDRAMRLVQERKPGPAEMLLRAAEMEGISAGRERLEAALVRFETQNPEVSFLGSADSAVETFVNRGRAVVGTEPFTTFTLRPENRQKLLDALGTSSRPLVKELLRFRVRTNTAIFPPSDSSAGQILDAAICISGLLVQQGHLTQGLTNNLFVLATEANRGGDSSRFEQALLDFLSLGQRLNWGQLVAFAGRVEDVETLRLLCHIARNSGKQLPLLFGAVHLSGKPAGVTSYVMTFHKTGVKDLGATLRFGAEGVNELLRRNQRLYFSDESRRIALDNCLRRPEFALTLKWLMYLSSGFLIAAAVHFARTIPLLERPLYVRGVHIAREILFALGFLLVVLLLSEPFLAQDSQKVELPFRLRLPRLGEAVPVEAHPRAQSWFMNQLSLLTLLLFFVIQALIYIACVVKLAEVRRQNVPPRVKLKLLENEDHLFDAGLYLGFVGTIISLILVSMGVIRPSLMAAYSSTSFGIVFVSVFKIFNLRPVRRRLLLESEEEAAAPPPAPEPPPSEPEIPPPNTPPDPSVTASFATPS